MALIGFVINPYPADITFKNNNNNARNSNNNTNNSIHIFVVSRGHN